jgi:uncharacterized protein YcaQ
VQHAIQVSTAAARRFLVRAFALDGFQTLPDVATALERLEFVQEDSINVCGRIHDLVLWPRVAGYAPSLLHDALYASPRQAFEYYFPNLCALPLTDYLHFVRSMRARQASPGRWHGLLDEELEIAEQLLAQMDADGPLRSRTTSDAHGHTTSGWGTRAKRASHVLEKLWLHGRVTVARRENFERWFDRTERLLPEVTGIEPPDEAVEAAYRMRKRLRARRVFRQKKEMFDLLGKGAFVTVHIEGDRRPWYALAEDADALAAAEEAPVGDALHLLAPLDPLVYDRERTQNVFGFEYTWEVYTPAAKRRWGYYVLPILQGDRLIGRVDPKIDRRTRTLTLHSLSLEPGVDPAEVAMPLAARLRDFARFLGAEQIDAGIVEPKGLQKALGKTLR